ncbi:hypothetical protein HOLleu_36740 [Holothuria leucospilota]|uniref:CCHC-type domain-containing protein n=1 Tax=Holothuria leucospilota TaxID=206669 RepID=A0A9Q0YRM3_HOLLE|nr:hypothetical protein HOLleu_36740 [Holothuria leucospilota]
MDTILDQFEHLITTVQLQTQDRKPYLSISGPCPRTDNHSSALNELNERLISLTEKLECRYVQNMTSFKYADGNIDESLYYDNVHLSRKGTNRLVERLSGIPGLCKSQQPTTEMRHYVQPQHRRKNFHSRQYHQNRLGQSSYPRQHTRHTPSPRNVNTALNRASSHGDCDNVAHPTLYRQNSYIDRGCYFCGEQNHTTKRCRYDKPIECRQCGLKGHKEKFCHFR